MGSGAAPSWAELVIEASPTAILAVDAERRIVLANRRAEQLFGYSRAELLELRIDALVPERFRAHHAGLVARFAGDPQPRAMGANRELWGVRKDGREVPLEIGLDLITTPERTLALASIVDISDRKRAESAAREQAERMRLALAASQVGIWDRDLRSDTIRWDDQMFRLYGIAPTPDLTIDRATWRAAIATESRASFDARFGATSGDQEYELIARRASDGAVRMLEGRHRVYLDAAGEPSWMIGTHRDVTELRNAENASRYLASIVESSDDAIVSKTLDGIITSWNYGAEQLFGFSTAEAVGQSIRLIIPEHLVPEEQAMMVEVAGGDGVQVETVRRRKDGSEVAVSVRLSPLLALDGTLVGFGKIARDITERKRQERALHAELAKNRTFLQAGSDGIHVVDMAGNVVEASDSFCRMLGYTRAEVLGMNVTQFSPGDLARITGAQGRVEFSAVHRRNDGTTFDADVTVQPFEIEGRVHMFCSSRDVTARRGAEARLHAVVEQSHTGIALTDLDARLVLANPALAAMTGYAASELSAMTASELLLAAPSANQPWPPRDAGTRELELRRKDGTTMWALVTTTPVATDHVLGWVVMLTDISQRKQLETELTKNLHEREVLLQEVHHRVKNNLQVISSLINLQVRTLSDDAAVDALRDCQRRVSAIAMIHELLYKVGDYARVPFDVYARRIAEATVSTLVTAAPVRLDVAVDPLALPTEQAIPCGLILNELITNALKHAFRAGAAGTIEVRMRRAADQQIELIVADNGVGAATGEPLRGSSLGTQLVASLAKQLRGTVEVDHTRGTRVCVRFAEPAI